MAGTSGNADKLLALVDDDPPEVAIVGIRMPSTDTDEAMKAALKIRAGHPTRPPHPGSDSKRVLAVLLYLRG